VLKGLICGLLVVQTATGPSPGRIKNTRLPVPAVGMVSYGISVPEDYRPDTPRPLIVALHAGGERIAYQGSRFTQELVLPGLGDRGAIVVAPDCPDRSWTEPLAEQAVLALVEHIRQSFAIDGRKILVVGFSMGGRGAWTLSVRHPEVFTAAIVMASPVRGGEGEGAGRVPTYVIHSRDDAVAPFPLAAESARRLQAAGHPIRFEAIDGAGHNMSRFSEALRRASGWLAERWSQ
jgi:predicted peptidase